MLPVTVCSGVGAGVCACATEVVNAAAAAEASRSFFMDWPLSLRVKKQRLRSICMPEQTL
jgi:hypothetical protein